MQHISLGEWKTIGKLLRAEGFTERLLHFRAKRKAIYDSYLPTFNIITTSQFIEQLHYIITTEQVI